MFKDKMVVVKLFVIIALLTICYNNLIIRTLPALKFFNSDKMVAIDPGHGNMDKGAVVNGVAESPINLAVALEIKEMLENENLGVVLTRDRETQQGKSNSTELRRRIDIAENANADILVSIHANKFPDPRYFGAQCFYNPQKPESKLLAQLIQEELKKIDPENTREALPQDLFILRESPMPAVLVEMGFLSNPKDRERLQDPSFQKNIAKSIVEGIKRYFSGDSPTKTPEHN